MRNNIKFQLGGLLDLTPLLAVFVNQLPENFCAEDLDCFKNVGLKLLLQGRKNNV